MNKKGFTMVELLGAVVILGILGTIGVVSVNKVLKSAHAKYYQEQNELFTAAAQTYFTDNKSKLPAEPMGVNRVTLKELIDQNYIEKIVDVKKNECNSSQSYAWVTRLGPSKYVYKSNLYCDKDNHELKIEDKNKTIITISFSEYSNFVDSSGGSSSGSGSYSSGDNESSSSGSSNVYGVSNVKKVAYDSSSGGSSTTPSFGYFTNNKMRIDINVKDADGLSAYKYIIYRGSKKYKESAPIELNKKTSYSDSIVIDKNSFNDGNYKVKVIAYDWNGNKTTKESEKFVFDTIPPKCEIKITDGTKGKNGWYVDKDITLSMTVDDKNPYQYRFGTTSSGSMITNMGVKFTKKQGNTQTAGVTYYGYVKDKAGNEGQCELKGIKVDKIAPTCKTELSSTAGITSTGWTKGDVTIKGKCSDSGSTCVSDVSTLKNTDTTKNVSPGEVEDKAGNKTECESVTVKIDKTPPTCTSNITSGTRGDWDWYRSDVTYHGTCSDGESGCKTVGGVTKTHSNETGTGGIYVSPGEVEDNVGNKTTCGNVFFGIDKTPPGCSSSGGSDSWTNGSRPLTGTCSDGGSNCRGNASYTVNWETNNSYSPGTVSDHAGNSTTCPNQIVKIDKTAPNCTTEKICYSTTYGSDGWCDESGGNVESRCKDSDGTYKSGCDSIAYLTTTGATKNVTNEVRNGEWVDAYYFGRDVEAEGTSTVQFTVKDKAGNQKTCTQKTVKIDKTAPTITSDSLCTNCKCPNDNNKVYPYVITYTVKDSGVGYKNGSFTWPGGSSNPTYANLSNSKHWICSSGKTGNYNYTICDNLDNCRSGSRKMDGSS